MDHGDALVLVYLEVQMQVGLRGENTKPDSHNAPDSWGILGAGRGPNSATAADPIDKANNLGETKPRIHQSKLRRRLVFKL